MISEKIKQRNIRKMKALQIRQYIFVQYEGIKTVGKYILKIRINKICIFVQKYKKYTIQTCTLKSQRITSRILQ